MHLVRNLFILKCYNSNVLYYDCFDWIKLNRNENLHINKSENATSQYAHENKQRNARNYSNFKNNSYNEQIGIIRIKHSFWRIYRCVNSGHFTHKLNIKVLRTFIQFVSKMSRVYTSINSSKRMFNPIITWFGSVYDFL